MKLEEKKKLQRVFKSNLNEKSRERYELEAQKMTLENITLLYDSRESVIKLLKGFFFVSKAEYKTTNEKAIPSILARFACGKGSDYSNLKILSPKQMLQRLPIALA